MSSSDTPSVDRRRFLAGMTVAGAAVGIGAAAEAQDAAKVPAAPARGRTPILTAAAEAVPPAEMEPLTTDLRSGADFMVDVLKIARYRLCRRHVRLELPRPARIDHRLRQQQEAGVPHLHPRGNRGRPGARLSEGRRQADGRDGALRGRPAARLDGHLQCLRRPRAAARLRRQQSRCKYAPPRRRMAPFDRRRRGADARLHQMGRPAGLVPALRRLDGAGLSGRHRGSFGAGGHRRRCRAAGAADPAGRGKRSSSFRNWPAMCRRRPTAAPCAKSRNCWSRPTIP